MQRLSAFVLVRIILRVLRFVTQSQMTRTHRKCLSSFVMFVSLRDEQIVLLLLAINYEASNFLGSSSFSVADFLQSKDQQLSLSLRTADDSATVGTVVVSRMKMGEIEDGEVDHITADMHQKCTLVYESSHGRISDKDNGPIMNAVFKNAVCKVYRFQTVDSKWMLVREQMAECTLSFSIPKQLIALYIQEDTCRIQELKDLGELSPHWDNLRKDVISRYDQIIKEYQDTLAELEKLTGPLFKPSCSKGQKYLEFIPINLHTQRMRVTCPRKTDSFYDVVTVGAPAAHSQGFKNGGLQKLLSKYETEKKSYSTAYQCIYYPPEQTAKAREILCVVSQLQPHISALADQLLQTAQQSSSQPLRDVLKSLEEKTKQFVHALKDELVKSALLALHAARPGYISKSQTSAPSSPREADPHPSAPEEPHSICNNVDGSQTPPKESRASPVRSDSIPHHKEYDEEEWTPPKESRASPVRSDSIPHHKEYDEEEWTKQFVHALKDELVKSALLALHAARPGYISKSQTSAPSSPREADPHPSAPEEPHSICNNVDGSQTPPKESRASPVRSDSIPHHKEYDEEEWDRVWASVAKSLNCVIALVDKLQEQDNNNLESAPSHMLADVITSHSPDPPLTATVWQDQLGVLIQSLKECVAEVAERARRSVSFVLLQEAVCSTAQGLQLQQRRDAVLSQALAALACGFVMRLYAGLEDKGFLRQLHAVGLVAQFESLLSTYSEFPPSDCLLFLSLLSEGLPCFQTQTDIKELLSTLGQNVVTKKRKNVEILWLAGMICRRINGIRFTSCKSAKDRTSMSVTLEQCSLLRDEHQLNKDYFVRALDCMRSGLLAQGEVAQWDDPEVGSVAINKPASRHFYPIALLLVSSHLLVVWLILSLVFLLAKYQ
ncbi:type II inositol 3,4-bisphosphate 4-phosphatase-like [Sinocyclocheilus grahami]|uniref:type II inositol 3,4-bisphosphate 4-phosphatase-like n=1 Tax=Sinocyclocheilus grahami TaxID=75366 RepID=UPI0007ACAD0E|nr:PREDICTED: type II inositol 3,4-bisphosphate 4-phosphatase-like [Sinocyclocheilus grahami]